MEDLSRLGLILREGVEIVVYCFELEVKGIVTYSTDEKRWVAVVDWDKIRNR
jgi:hypothetical protein